MNKWIGISLGALVGISHIGMIGMLATRKDFPAVNLPVGDYTAYTVEAGKEGYRIDYRANAPLVMGVRKKGDKPGGFLGLRKLKLSQKNSTRWRCLVTYQIDQSQRLMPPRLPVLRQKAAENQQEGLSVVGLVLALVLLLPLCLMLGGCLLVLLR